MQKYEISDLKNFESKYKKLTNELKKKTKIF